MEQHRPDPKEVEEPWAAVTDEFRSLGRQIGEAYRRMAKEGGPSEDELRQAIAVLVRAWDGMAGSMSETLRRPEAKEGLRRAASTLAAALGQTLTEVAHRLDREEDGV